MEFHQLIYIETSTKFCYNIFKDEVHNAVQAFPLLFLFNFLAILKRVAFSYLIIAQFFTNKNIPLRKGGADCLTFTDLLYLFFCSNFNRLHKKALLC